MHVLSYDILIKGINLTELSRENDKKRSPHMEGGKSVKGRSGSMVGLVF